MTDTTLPRGIMEDIEEVFSFRKDSTYQDRAHRYLEDYGVGRGARETAVMATVVDLCRRAFEASDAEYMEAEALDGDAKARLLQIAGEIAGIAVGEQSGIGRTSI